MGVNNPPGLSSILILNDIYLRIRGVIDAVVVVGYTFAGHGKGSIHTLRTSEDGFCGSRCLCGGCSRNCGGYRNRELNYYSNLISLRRSLLLQEALSAETQELVSGSKMLVPGQLYKLTVTSEMGHLRTI